MLFVTSFFSPSLSLRARGERDPLHPCPGGKVFSLPRTYLRKLQLLSPLPPWPTILSPASPPASLTCHTHEPDDIDVSVKRIHGMIADLEKEGYDAREIGKEQCNGRAKDSVADRGSMRPFPQSARCWETFCFESVCTVTCCAARREGKRERQRED